MSAAGTGDGPSLALGDFIVRSRSMELPVEVVERIQLLVLDSLGCSLLAAHLPWVERLLATLVATEAPGPGLVWGHPAQLSAANAALVNATSVHGFEFDDVGARGHWGSVTVPCALGLADAGEPLSGLDLVRAVAVGIEVGSRAAECVGNVPHVTCGFHGPGVMGTIAAAATSAAVLGLDGTSSAQALAHAGQFAGGLMATHHGGMGKRLLQGKAAHSGVLAGQLVRHGFTNVTNVFECGYGSFPEAFSGGRDTYDLAALTDGLGKDWRVLGVNFKLWACRVPIHPAVEAIRAIRESQTLPAESIASVRVGLVEGAFKAVGQPYEPTTVTAAQLNLRYCLAQMILSDDVSMAQFTEEAIRAPQVLDLVSRIEVLPLDTPADGPAYSPETMLEVTLHDGSTLRQVGIQRSAEHHPITRADVEEKFRRITDGVLSTDDQERLIGLSGRLTELPDARALTALVTPS